MPSCFLAESDNVSACFGMGGDASGGGAGVESQPTRPETTMAMAKSPTEANFLRNVIKGMPFFVQVGQVDDDFRTNQLGESE